VCSNQKGQWRKLCAELYRQIYIYSAAWFLWYVSQLLGDELFVANDRATPCKSRDESGIVPAEGRQWDNRPWMLQTKTVFLSQPHKISAPVWSYDKQNDMIQQGKYENTSHVKCVHCNYATVLPQDTKGDIHFRILKNKLLRKWPVADKWQVAVHQFLVGFSFSDAFHMRPDFSWTKNNLYRFTQRHVPQDGNLLSDYSRQL